MRIIYLHQYFNTPQMNGSTRSYEMARRLVDKGHEVHIITSWRSQSTNKTWFKTIESGVNVHWLPVIYSNSLSFTARIQSFIKFAIHAAKKAASIKADIVFATSTPLTIAIPAVYASKRQKIPMVFEVRDLWPEIPIAMGALKNPLLQFLAKRLEIWAYSNSRSIVALSPGMKEGIAKEKYPKERIAVIPNACDNDLFSVNPAVGKKFREQRPWLKDKPLLVYGGTFGLINGVPYMVELAKYLKHASPDIRILLVGDGREFELVRKKAVELEVLNNNLFLEQQIPKTEMPALFSAADIVVSLTINKEELFANSANKFFDALSAGKPIMINYGGWQQELLETTNAGFSTLGMNVEQAARIVIRNIYDEQWKNKANKASLSMSQNLFSRDQLVTQLDQVLQISMNSEVANISEITVNSEIPSHHS